MRRSYGNDTNVHPWMTSAILKFATRFVGSITAVIDCTSADSRVSGCNTPLNLPSHASITRTDRCSACRRDAASAQSRSDVDIVLPLRRSAATPESGTDHEFG